ncbi:hypothetical protein C8R44DRAFT_972947 [Mycena epipterygia]|nr:hypothetical protein C8R44DRAFT_972947 [Mycena epipterygia]
MAAGAALRHPQRRPEEAGPTVLCEFSSEVPGTSGLAVRFYDGNLSAIKPQPKNSLGLVIFDVAHITTRTPVEIPHDWVFFCACNDDDEDVVLAVMGEVFSRDDEELQHVDRAAERFYVGRGALCGLKREGHPEWSFYSSASAENENLEIGNDKILLVHPRALPAYAPFFSFHSSRPPPPPPPRGMQRQKHSS